MESEDGRSTKVCPDCAESVLTAARKCRFCGYRFDGEETMESSPAKGLRGLLRVWRPGPGLTMAGEVGRMGVDLKDEQLAGMWLGQIEGINGYVVMTSARLLFLDSDRHPDGPVPRQERFLNDLIHLEVMRRLGGTTLVIEWRHGDTTVISKLSAKDLQQLRAILSAHGPITDPPGM